MTKFIRFFLIISMVFATNVINATSAFMQFQSLHEVRAKIAEILKTQLAADVLISLDVDMTITQPTHPATYYPHIIKYKKILKNIFNNLSQVQRDIVLTLSVTRSSQRLIEIDSPKIVKDLQEHGAKVIAFTSSLTGHRNDHKNKVVFKRHDDLQKLGFNFNFLDRVVSYMDFSRYAGGYPIFYHGVLCANGERNGIGKGKVLAAFLKQIATCKDGAKYYVPKVVVMVDDRKKNLEDTQKVLNEKYPDMQFVGIEYLGALNYAPQEISQEDFTKFWQDLAEQAKFMGS